MEKKYTRDDIIKMYVDDHHIMSYAQTINNDIRSRVDEIMAFSRVAGYKKIGIAHCVSVTREAKQLERILENSFATKRVDCKVGRITKEDLVGSGWGTACNPIMQATILNDAETDLNIVMGLCVGHDLLFDKHSNAPSTTLLVKDEKFNNCPNKGLY